MESEVKMFRHKTTEVTCMDMAYILTALNDKDIEKAKELVVEIMKKTK